jgi:hypothetical protein
MRDTQIPHLLNESSIPAVLHVFSNPQSLIMAIKNRIYHGTAVAHSATKYDHAMDMARDWQIYWSYLLTAEMLTNCSTKPRPKLAFLK